MSADGRCSKWTSGDLCFYMQAYCDHKVEQQYVLNNYVIATSQTGGSGLVLYFQSVCYGPHDPHGFIFLNKNLIFVYTVTNMFVKIKLNFIKTKQL